MSLLFRKLAGMAIRKVASDPVARQKATEAARKLGHEAKIIARSDNKSYEAGRSAARLINKFKG